MNKFHFVTSNTQNYLRFLLSCELFSLSHSILCKASWHVSATFNETKLTNFQDKPFQMTIFVSVLEIIWQNLEVALSIFTGEENNKNYFSCKTEKSISFEFKMTNMSERKCCFLLTKWNSWDFVTKMTLIIFRCRTEIKLVTLV